MEDKYVICVNYSYVINKRYSLVPILCSEDVEDLMLFDSNEKEKAHGIVNIIEKEKEHGALLNIIASMFLDAKISYFFMPLKQLKEIKKEIKIAVKNLPLPERDNSFEGNTKILEKRINFFKSIINNKFLN